MSDEANSKFILEPPPSPDAPFSPSEAGPLFADDSIAATSAKFSLNEALLRLLTRDLKFADFSREILLTILKVVKSEAGSIFEVDHTNQSLFFRACVGESSERIAKFTIPMGKGIVGHVAESRQPLSVTNVKENEVHLKTLEDAVGFESRNLVAIPLIVRGQVYGVLELLNRIGEDAYTPADMDILNYFAEMASKAIEIRLMIAWAANIASSAKGQTGSSNSEAA